ncbi:MAG: KamA family radical SAM protein [Candidatus Aegiribacteria sp.]|nr:KamA family radical SAM protein [Candidatus Aegiribacteria sp.]
MSASITDIKAIPGISTDEAEVIQRVTEIFPFRTTSHYLSLVDWEDPHDPLRRVVVPDEGELESGGSLDPSREKNYYALPGMQHKYPDTVLLLVSHMCAGYCRYCFRKRLFLRECTNEPPPDINDCLEYIRNHPEVRNVLLTGGDPLTLSSRRLMGIISRIVRLPRIEAVRIGTRMLAWDPGRVIADRYLLHELDKLAGAQLYVMSHFTHSRELCVKALEAISLLRRCGVAICNQTPIIRGVNDSVDAMEDLFNALVAAGVAPYYIFQVRPTVGNSIYTVPPLEAYTIIREAQSRCSGLAARARYVISHHTGKLHVCGLTDEHLVMVYHRAAFPGDKGRTILVKRSIADNSSAFFRLDHPG